MEKDITQKQLEHFPDVAADIINGICFAGEQEVQPGDIQICPEAVAIKETSGRYRSRIRDVLYQINRLGICIAYIGIENQSDIDNTMPLRIMGMDYGTYTMQVREFQAENRKSGMPAYTKKIHDNQKLMPVISLVLNFGEPWNGPRCLLDMMDCNRKQGLSDYLSDYRMNLIDVSGEPELYKKFHSDFRLVVQYLHARKNPEELKAFSQNTQKLLHPGEVLDALYALGCNNRYLAMKEKMENREKEENTMCELLDYVENRGMEKGLEKGIEKGKAQGIISTAYSFGATRGMILERLCKELSISLVKAEEYMEMYVG